MRLHKINVEYDKTEVINSFFCQLSMYSTPANSIF